MANWYVKNGGGGANTGLSWTDAWTSFASVVWGASGVKAGDTLYIDGGVSGVTYTTQLSTGAAGSAGNPITIRVGQDAGHNGQVLWDFAGQTPTPGAPIYGILISHNYVTVDGSVGGVSKMKVTNLFTTNLSNYGHNVCAAVRAASGRSNVRVTYVDADNVSNGIYFVTPVANTEIDHCTLTAVRGDAAFAALNASQTGSFDLHLIHHNYAEILGYRFDANTYYGADGVHGGHGTSVYNNTFKIVDQGTDITRQHSDTLQSTGSYVKFYNNEVINIGDSGCDFDCSYFDTAPHDIWIFNNRWRIVSACDPYPQAIRFYGCNVTLNNVKIFNNLIADFAGTPAGGAIYVSAGAACTMTGWEIKGNVFVNSGTSGTSAAIHIAGTSLVAGNFDIDYNVFQSTSYTNFLGTQRTATAWVAFKEAHGKIGVPSFLSYVANALGNDFRLSPSDTVASLAGVSMSSYSTADCLGVARPASWDAGPFNRPPDAASSPAISLVNYNTLRVSWSASARASAYNVERSPNGSTSWASVGTPAASPFDDTGLADGTQYFYRVSSTNADGSSTPTGTVNAFTSVPTESRTPAGPRYSRIHSFRSR